MLQRLQARRVRVSLPDNIRHAHGQVDGLALKTRYRYRAELRTEAHTHSSIAAGPQACRKYVNRTRTGVRGREPTEHTRLPDWHVDSVAPPLEIGMKG